MAAASECHAWNTPHFVCCRRHQKRENSIGVSPNPILSRVKNASSKFHEKSVSLSHTFALVFDVLRAGRVWIVLFGVAVCRVLFLYLLLVDTFFFTRILKTPDSQLYKQLWLHHSKWKLPYLLLHFYLHHPYCSIYSENKEKNASVFLYVWFGFLIFFLLLLFITRRVSQSRSSIL